MMKNQLNSLISKKTFKLFGVVLLLGSLSSCTSYKSSWSCPNAKGIGCSSLEYADEVARKQILLNQATLKDISANQLDTKPILLIKTGAPEEEKYLEEQYIEVKETDWSNEIY